MKPSLQQNDFGAQDRRREDSKSVSAVPNIQKGHTCGVPLEGGSIIKADFFGA